VLLFPFPIEANCWRETRAFLPSLESMTEGSLIIPFVKPAADLIEDFAAPLFFLPLLFFVLEVTGGRGCG